MSRTPRFLLWALMLLLIGTTPAFAKSKAPDWVREGKDKAYPAIRYLIGIGSGTSLEGAKESARGELAKLFSVKIEADLETEQQAFSQKTDKGNSSEERERTRELVRTKSSETLTGVQIPATYTDEDRGIVYALAVLERSAAEERLETRIGELDTQMESLLAKSKEPAANALAKARALVTARTALNERTILNGQLAIVSPAGQGEAPKVDPAALGESLRQALIALPVARATSGDWPESLDSAFRQALAQSGLGAAPDAATAAITATVTYTAAITDKRQQSGFFFCEASLDLALRSPLETGWQESKRFSAKDGGKTEEEARRNAEKRLAQTLNRELSKLFSQMLAPKP